MMKLLRTIKTDNSGATAAEYALLIALIGGLIVTAAIALSTSISGGMNAVGATIDTQAAAVQTK